MNEKGMEYYWGLDMGTASVGWAVTDRNYKLIRVKRKDLWGARMFDEAMTAAGRRTNRVSRRRRQREVARIGVLKELFHTEIQKIDQGFYQRLEESKYHREDKRTPSKYSIFNDKNYTDKRYYEEFPTIFHLRKALIESKEVRDVRLVYLALLNMFKHRGHFLNVGLDANSNKVGIAELYNDFCQIAYEQAELDLPISFEIERLENILSRKDISRTKMAEEVAVLLDISKSKRKKEYELVKAICGLSFDLVVILGEEIADEEHKKIALGFRDNDYEQKSIDVLGLVGEEKFELVESMKQIHDCGLLANIMRGSQYLSQARVKVYEEHQADLKVLKRLIRKYAPESYDTMFRKKEEGNYSAYVGTVNSGKKERRNVKGRKQEDLYKTIKVILKQMPQEDEDVIYVLGRIEGESFLPKQLTSANGVIPNQVHVAEMKAILDNAKEYLPFLTEKDEIGLSVSDKIIRLFTFQIPYYVGPINEQHKDKGGNAWVVRREQGRVFPWNFEQKIDTKKSAEEFITRMIRHCTYINGEKSLPKTSLIYERFMVLNELNNLRIHGEKPPVSLKQDIYNDLFMSGKKVRQKQLVNYLIGKGILTEGEKGAITGIDVDLHSSLSSVGKFNVIFGERLSQDATKDMIEKIIFWGTIYGDDKKFFRECIEENFGIELGSENIKRIQGFRFRDWGRLSREFLELPGCDKSTGEVLPLIRMMWERNENLMELLSDRYTYIDELSAKSSVAEKTLSEMEYEDLDGFYLSAPVKRMVWQTLLILKELEEVLGSKPKRIFVEMAREDGKKGDRKDSRKKKLLELYKGCKEDGRDWCKEIGETDDASLRSKKLYLYYTQKGRCMYTGRPIELSDLFNDNRYDIDHIYPRHFVKDDSIENNLVLVEKVVNAHKSDTYPIEDKIYQSQHAQWRSLLKPNMESGFITREKYNRLTNRMPFSDDQLVGFISRQIVETRQGTKAVAQILEQVFPKSEIVYVKAGNVSDFRKKREMLKSRSVNDFHHAQDAYLNIVVGNTYYVKFTKSPKNFIEEYRKDAKNHPYHMDKIFNYTVKRGEEIAWVANDTEGEGGTIVMVRKMISKNTPLITMMNFEAHGELANATLYGAGQAKDVGYIPLKTKDGRMLDVKKYGGFSNVLIAYFFLVEHEKKGKKIRTLEAMPLYLRSRIGDDKELLEEYCKQELQLEEPDVRVMRVKKQSLIKRDGFLMYITGKTENRVLVRNGISLCLEQKWINYVKKIENFVDKKNVEKEVTHEKNTELYRLLMEKHLKSIYAKRPNPMGTKLQEREGAFLELTIEEQCNILNQLLQLSQLANRGANLQLLGETSAASGITKIGKNITDCGEFLLINQSVTGLFVSTIDLLRV